MSNKKWIVIVVLAAILVGLAGPAPVRAGDNVINCTGVEYPIAFLSPGVWKNVGGGVRVRGMSMQYMEEASCPQAAGINTVVLNANWDENQVGPMWGASHSEIDYGGGGVWEGTWQGKTNPDGSSSYSAVAHGVAGSVKGLIMWVTAYTPPGGIAQVSYTIRNPGD